MYKKRMIDHTGKRFGKFTVTDNYEIKNHRVFWVVLCDCGNKKIKAASNLKKLISCGCELIKQKERTLSLKSEKISHKNMIQRCYNKSRHDYKYYGERGITVCDRWINSFENFLLDMGRKPSKTHTIDRVDNEKGYSKENCRWATKKEQTNNRRKLSGTSKHKWIFFKKSENRWAVVIKGKYAGRFKTEKEAISLVKQMTEVK